MASFEDDVRRGLSETPKRLESKYFYDALGSTLFDAICRLPWYRITRAESRLLSQHARHVVDAFARADAITIVELGCGSGEKLGLLAQAVEASRRRARIHLVDVSEQALAQTEQRLSAFRYVATVRHPFAYEEGLANAVARRDDTRPMLVLFLGSNIGNFDRAEASAFVRRIRHALAPGDLLLLGADLVKPEDELLLAYDDPLGVTAAFNKNLLVRINRELEGTFDVAAFDHLALWNAEESRVEMHLVSRTDQCAAAAGARFRFFAGERVWTESSYKYDPAGIEAMGRDAGFAVRERWIDEDARFALTLFAAN